MIFTSRLISNVIVFLVTLVCFAIFVQQINAMECATGYEPSPDDTMCIPTGNSDTGSYEMGSAYNNTQETDDQYTSVDSVAGGSGTLTNPSGSVTNKPGTITNPGDTGKLSSPLQSKSIEEFILKIIDVLLVFAIPIIMLYIMYAGYLFVTARGDSGQITTARSALLWAVVGGVIVLGARVIIAVIQGTIKAF